MKKSRSFSQSTLFSPAIFSKISEFKEYFLILFSKFNQSQQKFNANSVHNKSLSVKNNLLRKCHPSPQIYLEIHQESPQSETHHQ